MYINDRARAPVFFYRSLRRDSFGCRLLASGFKGCLHGRLSPLDAR